MAFSNDHAEIRQLYANGGGVAQEWLIEQIVKYCSAHGLRDGRVTLADIKCVAAGKVSPPTLTKYIRDLLKCGALERVNDRLFYSEMAERICGSFIGRGNKLVRNCKNSFTPKNAFIGTESADEAQNTWPSAVPDLDRDLNTKLKAVEPTPFSSVELEPVAIDAAVVGIKAEAAPEPIAVIEPVLAPKPVVDLEVKAHVARQAGLGKRQNSDIADAFLSMGMSASGMSIPNLVAMQAVDLDDLDTEAILLQDRQETALLAGNSAPARAAKGPPPANAASVDPQTSEPPAMPQTTQRLPKSVIRFNLDQVAEAISGFTYGEKEVNALHKWPMTEAQFVDLRNAAVAHKRKGKLTVGIGAYLYGAVRRASLGLVPTRRTERQRVV